MEVEIEVRVSPASGYPRRAFRGRLRAGLLLCGSTLAPPRPGLETDLASRFTSSHRGQGRSLPCCSGYCEWHTLVEAEIEVEQCLGVGGKVGFEGVGGPTAQLLDTLVEYTMVSCVLGCNLAEAVARVVGLREVLGRNVVNTPPRRPGLETDFASRFKSSHRGHGRSLHCCSG